MSSGVPTSSSFPQPVESDFRWREQFTLAWLHAVCSPNLAEPIKPQVDDGVDAAIRFRRKNGLATLEAQIKSITPEAAKNRVSGEHLRYYLKRARAEKLTETVGFPVGLFAVVEVPDSQEAWCTRPAGEAHHLRLFNRSWWSLVVREGMPIPSALAAFVSHVDDGDSATVRIDMHHERHLDVASLNSLLDHIASWQATKGHAA